MPYSDPEKFREYQAEYRGRNKASRRAWSAEYRRKNREKMRLYSAAWRAANPERDAANRRRWYLANRDRLAPMQRAATLARVYGVDQSWVDAEFAKSGGICPICSGEMRMDVGRTSRFRCVVDHDHAAGQARGLICAQCNRGIGLFHDRPDALRAAATYLESFAESAAHGN